MKIAFSDEALKTFEKILTKYPTKKAATLPTLHLAQREFGWLSKNVLKYVAQLLEQPFSAVYDTASFYTMFKLKPIGKHHLQVCSTLSCALRGAQGIYQHLCERYGIENGGVTEDGNYSIEKVECLGSCGTAPVVQINDDYHENLTIEALDKILDSLK